MRRRIGVIGAVLVLAAGLAVPAATAARHLLVGIQDDAQTLYGNPTTTFPILRQLRAQIIRINLIWGGAPHAVAGDRRPAHPQDPSDPPASVLLERIAANRAGKPTVPPRRRKMTV